MTAPQWNVRRARGALAAGLLAWAGAGCSLDGLLKNDEVPPNVTDPAITRTRDGALAVYRGTLQRFQRAFSGFVAETGLLGDELRVGASFGRFNLRVEDQIDARIMELEPLAFLFSDLQLVRGEGGQAIGLLTRYAPEERALGGHAYALTGYAELALAEVFCSGIPLSTLDFDGGYTPKPGSTTAEVLTHAVALFDTALTLVEDNARFTQLAAVGKGRALLGLGDYGGAASAVAAVPDAYRYEVGYSAATVAGINLWNFARATTSVSSTVSLWTYSVTDQEGGNGLDYITSGDPRSAVTLETANNTRGYPVYRPAKYAPDGSSPLVLASGVEARLIQAEAALRSGDASWLAMLNALRTDGTFTTQPTADPTDDPSATDTLWHKGTGQVDGLRPLSDPDAPAAPGPTTARVDLLFRERAFWLFLTGHRQGDLRRLIRQYGRSRSDLYATGPYPGATDGTLYGDDVTAPVPAVERTLNPRYTGCVSRDP